MLNPLKQFNFDIEIDGYVQFSAQEVTLPKATIAKVEHGEGGVKKNTPGTTSFEDLTINMLMLSPRADGWAVTWFNNVRNGAPSQYLKNVVIRMKDNDGKTVVTKEYEECWVTSLGGETLSQTGDENVISEVVVVVNGIKDR